MLNSSAHNLTNMHILAEEENRDHFAFEMQGSNSSPLRSFPFSPLLQIENISRKSFSSSSSSYGKLPLQPIKLTVFKLDGSSFDISVVKNPTVTQLKQAVQDAFNHFPKHGVGNVSWSHVWAQFCLCFEGQKLLHDHEAVGLHWIKDGDQLQFVRHTSISYNLVKEKSGKHDYDFEEPKASPSKQECDKHMQKMERGNHSSDVQDNPNQQNKEDEEDSCDEIAVNITCQCSWAHLLRRLFAYRRQKGHNTSYKELASTSTSSRNLKKLTLQKRVCNMVCHKHISRSH